VGFLAMVWPKYQAVEPRYNCFAKWYTRIAALGILCMVMAKAYSVWKARWHPPTIHEFVNGKNPADASWDGSGRVPSSWGPMPHVLIDCNHAPTEAVDLLHGFEQHGTAFMCPTEGSKRLPYTSKRVPGSVWIAPYHLLINLTMATPCATEKENWFRSARLQVKFPKFVGENNCVLRVSDNPDVQASDSSVSFKFDAGPGSGRQKVVVRLSRSARPAPGIYWGLPGEGDHTMHFLEAELVGQMLAGPADGTLIVWMQVDNNGAIIIDKPVGLLPQFLSLVAAWGGFAASVSAVFLFCFVRASPPSEAEKQSQQLTLRFTRKKPKPSDSDSLDQGLLPTASS